MTNKVDLTLDSSIIAHTAGPDLPQTTNNCDPKILNNHHPLASIILASTVLYGCNSDSAGDTDLTDTDSLVPANAAFSGTVSTAKGLAETTVFLKTPQGETQSVELDDTGQFFLPAGTADASYLMRANLGNGNFLYSIAHLSLESGNRQNIHSYTDLAARSWFADQGQDINFAFTSGAGIENFPGAEEFQIIDNNIQSIVSDVLEVYDLADVNLSGASYEASDTGIDRFLNENKVIIDNNRATIVVNDPQTFMQATAVNQVALQTTFGVTDISPPQLPLGLRANGTGTNEIVLAWDTSTDNIGIASYEIYRDEELIGHTPFPIFRDSELEADTEYNYFIVAVDEAGNASEPSVTAIAHVLDSPDIEPPDVPSTVNREANTQEVRLFWSHSDLADVVRFEVTRTSVDGILIREVTSSRITDLIVASGTEYCYQIVAIDASDNRSESNQQSCITTSGATFEAEEDTAIPVTISMAQDSITGSEGTTVSAFVERIGDPVGEVSIDYTFMAGSATADLDYLGTDGTLVWSDGDVIAKRIFIELLADDIVEENETLSVVLNNSSTNAVVTRASTLVTIVDN